MIQFIVYCSSSVLGLIELFIVGIGEGVVEGGEPLSELHGRSRLIQFGEIFEIKILNDKWFCKINYPLDKPRSLTVQESPCVNNFVEVLKKFLNIAGQRILHLSIEQVKAIVK